jgi:hypothetical protein
MKVICKSTKDYSDEEFWMGSLTVGKEYDILDTNYISHSEYMIMNDYGFEHLYPVKCFVTKQELREDKLNELGI